jgi:hypothetical protein
LQVISTIKKPEGESLNSDQNKVKRRIGYSIILITGTIYLIGFIISMITSKKAIDKHSWLRIFRDVILSVLGGNPLYKDLLIL